MDDTRRYRRWRHHRRLRRDSHECHVTKDVPAYVIVAGNPATVIGDRTDKGWHTLIRLLVGKHVASINAQPSPISADATISHR